MPAAGTAALAMLSQPWRSQSPSRKGASVQVVHEDAWCSLVAGPGCCWAGCRSASVPCVTGRNLLVLAHRVCWVSLSCESAAQGSSSQQDRLQAGMR